MFTIEQDDDILMIVPFVLVPLQLFYIRNIHKQTPFIIRQSVSYPILITLPLAQTVCLEVHIVRCLSDVNAMHASAIHLLRSPHALLL